jgi:[ribosomal protein S5]-alanine N-acetyltransferase
LPSCFVLERDMSSILETPRLLLRKLASSDVDVMVRELNNFAIARNTARVPYPYHRDDALEFLQFVDTLDERSCVAGVELKSAPGSLIGIISYQWSKAQQDAELGYWFAEHMWGKGIGSEAAEAMVGRAFTLHVLEKIVACFHDDNPASGRILIKLGFQPTGSCMNFSKAQGREVPVTNMQLHRAGWVHKKAAD